jgi:aspartyl-tRNA(Asn)/glutamyl-tRNA(Gln) amidotransferase subunit B
MTSHKHFVQRGSSVWEVVVGLEIHAQITSQAKLFSGASTAFGADPNTQVSFVDAGFPGMLPVINAFCVEQAIKTGLGLNAEINLHSVFDRKNYFYPDLPQGYQISQYHCPIVGKGYMDIEVGEETKRIGITRLHLEQDAGKSIHDQHPTKSLIDLNRSGIALMEIVTEPDLRSAEETQAFMRKLRSLLRCLGTCDGNMEQGSMRADVNISLRRPEEPYGTRAEIKNINSVRFIGQAIAFEIDRQLSLLENGGKVDQETRLFDSSRGVTRAMRSKEEAHDYRYFPDPDLPPLIIHPETIIRIQASLPELPDQKKKRFMDTFFLNSYDAGVLTAEMETAHFFETALAQSEEWNKTKNPKIAKLLANWLTVELFSQLNKEGLRIEESKISNATLAQLIDLIHNGTISGKIAKTVFSECWTKGQSPAEIIKAQGLEQVSDDSAILAVIDQVIRDYPQQVADFKAGKDKIFGFLVGMVMKGMHGKASPQVVNDLLRQRLNELR